MKKTHYKTCPICEATCGLEIQTENNAIISIKGDKNDVLSGGYVCVKGRSLDKLHNDKDRIRMPLIKRNGLFQKASYQEAFDFIRERIQPIIEKEGKGAMGIYLGNPVVHNASLFFYIPILIRAMRTTNVFSASTVDQIPKQLAGALMYGSASTTAVPDIDNTDHLIIVGANPYISNGSMWTVPGFPERVKQLQKRNGKLIVIDPHLTKTAQKADEHFFIKPGTDAFFLFAMLHVLFKENLIDTAHLTEHINGLEKVHTLAEFFSPDAVSDLCKISPENIERITRDFAGAGKAVIYGRMGISTQNFGTICNWLIDVLNICTGNLDREGGAMFPLPASGSANTRPKTGKEREIKIGRKKTRVKGLPISLGENPAAALADEILTPGKGQIKALFTVAGNPVVSTSAAADLPQALQSLEFMVSLDQYVCETTKYADVILPGLSPLEKSHFDWIFASLMTRNTINFSEPVLKKTKRRFMSGRSFWPLFLFFQKKKLC